MTEGLWILCLAIGVFIIVIPLAFWLEAIKYSSFITSFEEFYECYKICPDDFILHNGCAKYISKEYDQDRELWVEYIIGFGFISWIKYCLWMKITLIMKKKKKLNKNYKDFVKHMMCNMNCDPKEALHGMMVKHTTSISDMCRSGKDYPMDLWEEKIKDNINYLLLLKAIVVEQKSEETPGESE